ncbi:MAG TPA: hypothetical protein VG370_11120 [Chloroflexota bacterium]|jgi:hypothetical protein|nr:hypothetical protein [Chloroflexota bacterium]
MKRRNVQMAFVGEGGGPSPEAATALLEGDEAVDMRVTGGYLRVVVPAGTPDRKLFDDASVLGGELVLENGQRFTFEIQEDAEGALYSATAEDKQTEPQPDLSTISNSPA